ncbi:MAG: hypothetical protein A2Z37_03170 [Chloroflexi bacterium RBG_19FT_COMBO_62_14]|nr:MAG: hypothetical protein A2Z37_03170 [Chloroflexi bacterium RBG_19FT_COMBO_62_14]
MLYTFDQIPKSGAHMKDVQKLLKVYPQAIFDGKTRACLVITVAHLSSYNKVLRAAHSGATRQGRIPFVEGLRGGN